MDSSIKVLDHGHVRLVAYMGNDQAIVRSARVSYDAEPRNDGSDEKLIHYLLRNGHTSPFESVNFTFDVKAPIFVFRQWHRHRTWSYNEVSARYTALPEEFYVPELDHIGEQSKTNKQMRVFTDGGEADFTTRRRMQDEMWMAATAAFKVYRRLIDHGCPRELARAVLPVSTYSHMFASVDLHNLFHFLKLRLHEHAQYEIRVYAEAMLEIISLIVPVAVAAFRKHTLGEET
jgi:thymidylate synthase (FAD)